MARELKHAFSIITRAYAQLGISQKSSILSYPKTFYKDILLSLESHDIYNIHKLLKQDITFMERLLLLDMNVRHEQNAGD